MKNTHALHRFVLSTAVSAARGISKARDHRPPEAIQIETQQFDHAAVHSKPVYKFILRTILQYLNLLKHHPNGWVPPLIADPLVYQLPISPRRLSCCQKVSASSESLADLFASNRQSHSWTEPRHQSTAL